MNLLSNKRGLHEREAADYCGLSAPLLRLGRLGKTKTSTPPFLRIGRRVIYLQDDLDQWLEQQRDLTMKQEVAP